MKKSLLILSSVALLLIGCAKEKFAGQNESGLQEVSFTANIESGVATKAANDNDGAGAYVNRCIMEIYFGDALYKRMEEDVTPATDNAKAYATFANVPVVAGKEYRILFWADHVDNAETPEGLATDKYYDTDSQSGLKAVQIVKDSFIEALEEDANTNDYLDAFFGAANYTVTQNGEHNFNIQLKRPFAQLNIITTDVGTGKTVFKEDLLPEKVSVSYEAANTINVSTGEISKQGTPTEAYTFAYEAPVYGLWSTITTDHPELTLSMDYILASTEQGAVDVTFKTLNGTTEVMSYALTNLPYKRNYRTNVKGNLLTIGGSWTATIDTTWLSPDIVKVVEVADIKSANEIIEDYAETTKNLEVKFVGVPNDSGVPTGVESSQYRAIRTSPLQQGANLGIEVMTSTNTLYVGDYLTEYKVTGETVAEYIDVTAKQATVNINVPANSGIGTLIINAPSKTVLVNGHLVDNVGTITNIDAITSQNTLIIEPGQEVGTLTMRQGGLEIHGTVGEAIVPSDHGTISVRDCENLDETKVYNILQPHIDENYIGVKDRTTPGLWDIVPIVCMIGDTPYGSLSDAVAAAPANTETTILMVKDVDFGDIAGDGAVVIPSGKVIILDLNGKKISASRTVKTNTSIIANDGTLTIADNAGNGEIYMNSTVDDSGWSSSVSAITNRATLIVNSGHIHTDGAAGMSYAIDSRQNGYSHDVVTTIEGGLIEAPDYRAIRLFANGTNGADNLVVSGGEIIGKTAGIWLQDTNVYKNKANVTISGGKITATGDTRHALYIDGNTDTEGLGVTITGGQFKSPASSVFVENCTNISKFISGGVFSDKPADELVADNYIAAENADATYPWKVVISPDAVTVAKIGTTEYYSLSDALAAAKEGEAVYIIPDQLEETVSASNDNNIQLILDGKIIIGDIAFGGKGTLIVRAEELNKDYYSYPKAYEVDAPTIPAQGVGGIMGKISATGNATVMLRENLYSGPFEGKVELRGGYYYSGLGFDNIKAQTPGGIGLVVEEVNIVQGYSMYYVPEVPESYLVHLSSNDIPLNLLNNYFDGDEDACKEINELTLGYGLSNSILTPNWFCFGDGDLSLEPSVKPFPDDIYAFFTNLKDNDPLNPKSMYQTWYCDFEISYSEPIEKDYQSGIWGYYNGMNFGCWLPKSVTTRQFGMMKETFGRWEYSAMLENVRMFLCGPKNINHADSGKVITVSLNIYPDSDTEECITTNKVVYTIPAISE